MKNKFDAEHEFDKAARDAFEHFEFPFDKKDWESFQTAYEEDKKKNYKFFLGRSILNNKGWMLALVASVSACFIGYALHIYTIGNVSALSAKSAANGQVKTTDASPVIKDINTASSTQTPPTTTPSVPTKTTNTGQENSTSAPLLAEVPSTAPTSIASDAPSVHSSLYNKDKTYQNKTYRRQKESTQTSLIQGLEQKNYAHASDKATPLASQSIAQGDLKDITPFDTKKVGENHNAMLSNASAELSKTTKPNSLSQNKTALAQKEESLIHQRLNLDDAKVNQAAENTNSLKEHHTKWENTALLEGQQGAEDKAENKESILLPNIALNANIVQNKKKKDPGFELRKTEPLKPFAPQFRLGMLTGIENYSNNSYGRGTVGFNFGLLGERTFTKIFSLQIGLNASFRKYEKLQILDLENSMPNVSNINENLNTHLVLFQIPVLLQWDIFVNKQWRIYAQTGVNTYLNFSQYYSGVREVAFEQNGNVMRFTSNIGTNEYEGALLQTKSLKNNIFFTGQIGLGIERRLSDKWSLFVQPNMQYVFKSMNAAGDKGHILAFHVGAKTTL